MHPRSADQAGLRSTLSYPDSTLSPPRPEHRQARPRQGGSLLSVAVRTAVWMAVWVAVWTAVCQQAGHLPVVVAARS